MSSTIEPKPADNRLVHLIASDSEGKVVCSITRDEANWSLLIKSMLQEDDDEETEIPLGAVESDILLKVVAFLKVLQLKGGMKDIVKPIASNDITTILDAEFIEVIAYDRETGQKKFFDLILAANYLDIPQLLDATLVSIACKVKSKTPEEVKQEFKISPDITSEEEKLVRENNPWIFEVTPTSTSTN